MFMYFTSILIKSELCDRTNFKVKQTDLKILLKHILNVDLIGVNGMKNNQGKNVTHLNGSAFSELESHLN